MPKKIVLFLVAVGLIILTAWVLFSNKSKSVPFSPIVQLSGSNKSTNPSETFIEYADPTGFSFSYPDNLSLEKQEVEDEKTYATLQLSSKEVSGSLSLKITDSNIKTLDEWAKKNAPTGTPKEVKLGSLKALEVKTSDRLFLGALDQGILFTIEMPLIEEGFWGKVYSKILADFSFATPTQETTDQGATVSSSSDIVFEGEEVIE